MMAQAFRLLCAKLHTSAGSILRKAVLFCHAARAGIHGLTKCKWKDGFPLEFILRRREAATGIRE